MRVNAFLYTYIDILYSGIYDQDYLNYLIQVLKKCEAYNLKVYIDPHQDCVSVIK